LRAQTHRYRHPPLPCLSAYAMRRAGSDRYPRSLSSVVITVTVAANSTRFFSKNALANGTFALLRSRCTFHGTPTLPTRALSAMLVVIGRSMRLLAGFPSALLVPSALLLLAALLVPHHLFLPLA